MPLPFSTRATATALLLGAFTGALPAGIAAQPVEQAVTGAGARRTTPAPPPAAAPSEREQTADQQVLHALNRLGFGPRPGDVTRVRQMGVDAWIGAQLQPDRLSDSAGEALAAAYPALALPLPALMAEYQPPQLLARQRRGANRATMSAADSMALQRQLMQARRGAVQMFGQLQSMRVARAVVSERQLDEVMVDFWENHFNVDAGKGPLSRYFLIALDRDAIRPHALGHFRDLLGAVAHSPAMLFYLDNVQSQADSTAARPGRAGRLAPAKPGRRQQRRQPQPPPPQQGQQQQRRRGLNENYARELLELHTLGVDGGYTQADVIDVARALTGWSVVPPQAGATGFIFRPQVHDAGLKHVLGHTLRAGRGVQDGEEVLDILARHPATARFIATKLARRFVSDDPPPALVERATAMYLLTDGDIREVVRTIVTSPEFFSSVAFRAKVKSPFEVVVSALRAVGAGADRTPRTAQIVALLGQPLFGHQAPDGWPETGDAWVNTGAILNRINFGLALAGGRMPGVSLSTWPAGRALVNAPREAQVDGVVRALLGGAVSTDTRQVLLSGEHPLFAQADRAAGDDIAGRFRTPTGARRPGQPMEPMHAPADAGPPVRPRDGGRGFGPPPRLQGLALVVGLALGSPEFQRR